MGFASRVASLGVALATSGLAATVASRGVASVADVRLGTEAAFALPGGLHARENIPRGGSLRWTGPRATFIFDHLPPGSVDLTVRVRGHRLPVRLAANGALVGEIAPGAEEAAPRISIRGSRLRLDVEVETFEAGGRSLGTQIVSLVVRPERGDASMALAMSALAVTGLAWACAWAAGLGALGAGAVGASTGLLLLALVAPAGLWRSPALGGQAIGLVFVAGLAALVARRASGGTLGRAALCLGLVAGGTLHGLVPPSALVVQGDAQFHANRLADVASGNLFITSRTQHVPPFQFPYGFSFYALLAPLARLGVDRVELVRWGAGAAGAASLFAFAWVLSRRSAAFAACAVALWTFVPVNVRIVSFGNLSNVFAQAALLLALAAAARASKPAVAVSLLAFLSATAHLSGFVVVAALAVCALAPGLASADERRSAVARGLGAGAVAAALYYATFTKLVLDQAPRLLGERGGSGGAFDPLRWPTQVGSELSWPFVLMVALGWFTRGWADALPVTQAQLKTGVALVALAQLSPLEVRYFLALVPLLAVVAASPGTETRWRSWFQALLLALTVAHGARLWIEISPVWSRLLPV